MMPMTSSMDILPIRWENSRTMPMTNSDPAKAAATMTEDGTLFQYWSAIIMTNPTVIFAPEEIPNTKGPAIGLRKPDLPDDIALHRIVPNSKENDPDDLLCRDGYRSGIDIDNHQEEEKKKQRHDDTFIAKNCLDTVSFHNCTSKYKIWPKALPPAVQGKLTPS